MDCTLNSFATPFFPINLSCERAGKDFLQAWKQLKFLNGVFKDCLHASY
jgi:hypothetical protein